MNKYTKAAQSKWVNTKSTCRNTTPSKLYRTMLNISAFLFSLTYVLRCSLAFLTRRISLGNRKQKASH